MKKFKFLTLFLLTLIAVYSCKKVEGPQGPQGPQGLQGPTGSNGNANIKIYGYGPCTFSSTNLYMQKYTPVGLTSGLIDSSVIYAYYSAGYNQWNVVNGFGPEDNYVTVLFTDIFADPTPFIGIYLRKPDGTLYSGPDINWDSVRIVIIPATIFMSAQNDKVDFKNHFEAMNYLNNYQ